MSMTNEKSDIITSKQFLKLKINNHTIAIPIVNIRDILILGQITKVPLSPDSIIGLINLRGRVVTAINIRNLLQMNNDNIQQDSMNIVIENNNDLYSIIADSVDDVITVNEIDILAKPNSIDKYWEKIASGIILGKEELIVVIDIKKLFSLL